MSKYGRRRFLMRGVRLGAGLTALSFVTPALSLARGSFRAEELVDEGESLRRGRGSDVQLMGAGAGTAVQPVRVGGRFTSGTLQAPFPFSHVGLHWAENDQAPRRTHHTPGPAVCSDWQVLEAEAPCACGAVCDHMTANPVTVAPATPLGELARMMLDAHIHRVIVVDADDRPIGVVSSTDILAAVAYADIVKGAK